MKTATVRELRNEFPKLASYIEAGEEILLTRHSKPIAKISPIREDMNETVDWSHSAAFQMNRNTEVLSKETVEDVLAESKGGY